MAQRREGEMEDMYWNGYNEGRTKRYMFNAGCGQIDVVHSKHMAKASLLEDP